MLATLLLIPVIFAGVGTATYGDWLVLSAVANYLNYLDFGIGTAVVHFTARLRGGDSTFTLPRLFSAAIVWNSSMAVIGLAVLVPLGVLYMSSLSTSKLTFGSSVVLQCLAAAMLLSLAIRPAGAFVTGLGHLAYERRTQTYGLALRTVVVLAGALVVHSIEIVALGDLCAVLVPSLVALRYTRRNFGVKIKLHKSLLRQDIRTLLSYGSKTMIAGAVSALILQAGTFLTGVTGTSSGVAYFNAAFRVYASVRQIAAWVTDPFRSALSRLGAYSPSEFRDLLQVVLGSQIIIGVTLVAAIQTLLSFAIPFWLGGSAPSEEIIIAAEWLLLGMALICLHLPLIPALDAAGLPGTFTWPQVLWLILYVAGGFVLGARVGFEGVAIAMTGPLIVVEPLILLSAVRRLSIGKTFWRHALAVPAACSIGPLIVCLAANIVLSANFRATLLGALTSAGVVLVAGCLALAIWSRVTDGVGIRAVLRSEL